MRHVRLDVESQEAFRMHRAESLTKGSLTRVAAWQSSLGEEACRASMEHFTSVGASDRAKEKPDGAFQIPTGNPGRAKSITRILACTHLHEYTASSTEALSEATPAFTFRGVTVAEERPKRAVVR
jgi:hypothetical protein